MWGRWRPISLAMGTLCHPLGTPFKGRLKAVRENQMLCDILTFYISFPVNIVEDTFILHDSEAGLAKMAFQPTITDMGLCLAANAAPLDALLQEGHPYVKVYNEAFDMEKDSRPVLKNMGTGEAYGMEFYAVNHRALNSLKDNVKPTFHVALNGLQDVFNVREAKIKVRTGYHTIIHLQGPQVTSVDSGVEWMDAERRGCRLALENENMELLSNYTKSGCQYECLVRHSAQRCRCLPWDFPNPVGNISRTCDIYSARCFELAMSRKHEVSCDCPEDCHGLRCSRIITYYDAKVLCYISLQIPVQCSRNSH